MLIIENLYTIIDIQMNLKELVLIHGLMERIIILMISVFWWVRSADCGNTHDENDYYNNTFANSKFYQHVMYPIAQPNILPPGLAFPWCDYNDTSKPVLFGILVVEILSIC